MDNTVDYASEQQAMRKKRGLIITSLCAVSAICLVGCILLLLFSPFENYGWYLAGAVALSCAAGGYGVYLFTNPLKDISLNLKWYNRILTSPEEKLRLKFIRCERHNYDGIDTDLLTFVNGEGEERSIYCLSGGASLVGGEEYLIICRANSLVCYGVKK